jgi:hypothetical protein
LGLLALVLLAAFKLASLFLGPKTPQPQQDKQAMAALRTLESALRPESQVSRRIGKPQDVAHASACSKEAGRLLGHLTVIEEHLRRMAGQEEGDMRGNRRLPERLVVDADAWKAALADRSFGCPDLERGLSLLARNDGAALESLEWRGATHGKLPEGQWMKIPAYGFSRPNPWGGLPGCILLGEGKGKGGWYAANGRNSYCATAIGAKHRPAGAKAAADAAWLLPDSLDTLLSEVDAVRLPATPVYREATSEGRHGPNRLALDGHERETGFHVRLTLEPRAQRIAQQTARCYAGERDACTALGLTLAETARIGAEFYEHAAVRMTGVAIVDVASGRIEALASAHTECFRQQYDGPGRDERCPNLTRPPRYSPDMLLNHAVFSDAMPASTVKPILALGFLETPGYRVDDAQLTHELKHSLSERFLDRLFCLDTGAGSTGCARLARAQAAAAQLGWNSGCSPGGTDCGFADVLFGRAADERLDSSLGAVRPLGLRGLNGRLFTAPLAEGRMSRLALMPEMALQFDPANARDCHNQRWRNCVGNPVATTAAEGWGQGSARATPLGVAALFARLGAAAEGMKAQRRAHLMDGISDIRGQAVNLAGLAPGGEVALDIPPVLALRVVKGLSQGHTPGGTAHKACASSGLGDCASIHWVAGKTGTPPFGFDLVTLEMAAKQCEYADSVRDTRKRGRTLKRCDKEIPYKWYAALFKSGDQAAGYDKAIAVLSERNWHESGPLRGKVDAPGDNGPNRSAEIAFRIMGKLRAEVANAFAGGTKP